MAGEKFYLIFSEEPNKRIQVNEPIGYSEVDFSLDQRESNMGRDVSLSGGKVNFRFTLYRQGKAFEKILYYAHYYGFESDVKLIIILSDGTEFTGELDFVTAESNDFNYFECPVILESELQIFRRRNDTKVDLFSSVDTNGNFIAPLVPINMLLQAKPSIQTSIWKQYSPANYPFASFINITQSITQSDIQDSYVPLIGGRRPDDFNIEDFVIVKAQSNLKNVSVLMKNIDIIGNTNTDDFFMKITIAKGFKDQAKQYFTAITTNKGKTVSITGDLPITNIGDLQREEQIYIYLENKNNTFLTINNINSIDTTITSELTAYNSIVPCVHVIDALKQIAKSTSGLDVYAPRYDVGGDLYGTVITNGKLLGGNTTDPFYVSWEDLFEKSIGPEQNADSEIQLDKRIFCGIEDDYYTGEECGFFPNTQFSGMVRKANPMYCSNSFNYKYENYQSLKENTEPNSESTIHGQSILTPYNQKAENGKELSIKYIRDAILWDTAQRLSIKVSKDTATQDDDKIFAIDTLSTENDQKFTESTNLKHTYVTGTTPYLSLRNNGEVNFLVLGIRIGATVTIEYPDKNAGNYEVLAVVNTELQLKRTSGGAISTANDGIMLTKYTYEIKKETIPLTNRTNQGFNVVLNIISPERYSNLRYSVQRNIRNFWNKFLATVNLYHKDKSIKNTYYKNNGACETEYAGLRVIEKEDFIPDNPIVTPYRYDNVVFANVEFSHFKTLQNEIRTKRGFIRTIDNNRRALKLYPIKMSYQNKTRQLTISGQEKFEKAYLTIETQGGIITINNETRLRKLIYDKIALERDKVVILFDLQRQRLYNGIYFDKVSINGVIAPTIEILKGWLDLL